MPNRNTAGQEHTGMSLVREATFDSRPNITSQNREYRGVDLIHAAMRADYDLLARALNDKPELILSEYAYEALEIALSYAADFTPIRILIERGLDMSVQHNSGRTFLEIALRSDSGMFAHAIEECILAREMAAIHVVGDTNEGYTSE